MCIGIPMQVIESHALFAIGADGERVDTALVGQQAVGSWLLVSLGIAREVLDAQSAQAIRDALTAVDAVLNGRTEVDHLFADLVDREPPLPDHLKHLVSK